MLSATALLNERITWTIRTRQPDSNRSDTQPEGLWQLGAGGRVETTHCSPQHALLNFFAQRGSPDPIDGAEYMVTPNKFCYAAIIRVTTSLTLELVL